VQVDPQHLSVLSGVGAVLDLLFQCISEPGDGVLIPAPYYPAFDNDLRVSVDNSRTRRKPGQTAVYVGQTAVHVGQIAANVGQWQC
jgi:hypothetical protein